MELTETQKAAYIKNSHKCPICMSVDIKEGTVEREDDVAWHPVFCHNCGSDWDDKYILKDVELNDIPDELKEVLGAKREDLPLLITKEFEYPYTKIVLGKRLKG